MCCEGKCFGCIKVETGSLIFGVFTAVLWALSVICSTIGLIVVNVWFNESHYQADVYGLDVDLQYRDGPNAAQRFIINTICGVVLAVGLLNFLFAVLLCNGVNKRNVGQIKAYFIYGIVTTVLSSIAIFIFGALCINGSFIMLIFLGLVPIVIYCFILHMIKMTMDSFTTGDICSYNHRILVETESLQMTR